MSAPAAHGDPGHVHDEACAAAHGELVLPPDQRRLVVVFVSPVAQELAALADRLRWPVTVIDPDARRLDEDPVPYARCVRSVADAGLDAGCDVVVCDHDRPELGDVLAAVLAGPTRWVGVMGSPRHTAPHVAALQERGLPAADIARVHRPIGLDVGSRSPAEIALSTAAGLLADRNGRPGGPYDASPPAGGASPVRVVTRTDLVDTDPTSGMRRQGAIDVPGLWAGLVHTEPGAVSGWHHHGAHETSLHVLTGQLALSSGPGGAEQVVAGPGEFVHVPAWAVHREANPTDVVSSAVIARSGLGAPTINVDGPDPA